MTSPTGNDRLQCAGRANPGGFTLMELILVLLLLGLAASMTAPLLGSFTRGRTAADAGGHLLAIIQYAQDQAIITSQAHRVNVDLDKGVYWLTVSKNGPFSRISSEIGRDFQLPEHLTLTMEASPTVMEEKSLQFNPDGSHDVAILRLTDSQGKEIILGCASPAESYRLGVQADIQEVSAW